MCDRYGWKLQGINCLLVTLYTLMYTRQLDVGKLQGGAK